ncbi:MAG: hypothetical protein EA419_12490 [Wenzhouxiangella sp.]|nr:MAG: hypothetical protein EA419_12490 [Wenzhouxiangella sp.]
MNPNPSRFARLPCARLAVALLVLPLLGACGLTGQVSPVSIIAPEIELQTDAEWSEVDWALQVRRPVTDQMRDSERILIRTGASRLQPYPAASWLDNVPDMLHSLTIQALEDSGRFDGVGRAGSLRSRFALATELRRFEGVDDGSADLAVDLVIQSNLVEQRSGRVAASRTFTVRQQASGKGLDDLVIAFERAMEEYVSQLTGWVLVEGELARQQLDQDRQQWRDRRR